MKRFKKGDIVVCIDGKRNKDVEKGRVYEVFRDALLGGAFVWVLPFQTTTGINDLIMAFSRRFILYKSETIQFTDLLNRKHRKLCKK